MISINIIIKNPSKYLEAVHLFQNGMHFCKEKPTLIHERDNIILWICKKQRIFGLASEESHRVLIKSLKNSSKNKIIKIPHKIAFFLMPINAYKKSCPVYLELNHNSY